MFLWYIFYPIEVILQYMKSIQKKASLKEDQKFLEGINLVTGVKIDYGKHLLTDSEVSAMCINEALSPIDKLAFILTQGEKIQKWSIFENLAYYIESADHAERMLLLLEKNYVQYQEFLMIIGQGLLACLHKSKSQKDIISKKSADLIYRLAHRTVTAAKLQGSEILADWMSLLTSLFELPDKILESRSIKLSQLRQYINGSFSMNTLPQRRKTALQLINALLNVIELSQQVEKQAHNKILFFNSDTNPSTRLVICHIVEKLLKKNCQNNDLWKCLHDYYYNDKSYIVKDKAFQIIVSLKYSPNYEIVFRELENEDSSFANIVHRHTTMIFKTFSQELKKHQSLQFKVISFLNRLLRNNSQLGLRKLIDGYVFLTQSISEAVLAEQLQLKKFDLQNINVIDELLLLHNLINHLQFREQIKKSIFKGIRFHDFDMKISKQAQSNLLDMLDLHQQEDISTFSIVFSKLIENSKWNYIELFLGKIQDIRFFQSQYQKIIGSIIKIYQNCPYFLLEKMHSVILFLMLSDRKNLEIYLKLRDKFQMSRCWTHRRNYIKLYAFLKRNASYQFNRNIAPLLYKSILAEKNSLIKQEFLRDFTKTYSFLDPTNQQEKNSIKQTILKMAQDKDKEVSSLAIIAIQTIKEAERDYQLVGQLLSRNKSVFQRELEVQQVQSQTKKHIKTEKIISGKDPRDVKPKKISNLDTTKTSLNLMKLSTQRNKALIAIQAKPTLKRSTSNQPKQNVLKFNLPSFKKGRI